MAASTNVYEKVKFFEASDEYHLLVPRNGEKAYYFVSVSRSVWMKTELVSSALRKAPQISRCGKVVRASLYSVEFIAFKEDSGHCRMSSSFLFYTGLSKAHP